jgi:hypothetical protein
MDSSRLARTSQYSPTGEPESATFAAAGRAFGSRSEVGHEASADDPRAGDETARLALCEALCVLANAAARLEGGAR